MDHLEPIPLWTLVANIKQEISYGEGKMETHKGSKQFSPGTKVHIIDWYAGMCKDITLIGLSRDTKKINYDCYTGRMDRKLPRQVMLQP